MRTLKKFVRKCCLIADNARYPAVELYLAYVNWCINAGTTVHDQFTFLEMLESHGFPYRQCEGSCWFNGISVLPNFRPED